MSWPALEGLVAYLFLITVTWRLPGTSPINEQTPVLGGFVMVGLGGALVALAYWRERTRESAQPRLHGTGTALITLGTVGIALLPLV